MPVAVSTPRWLLTHLSTLKQHLNPVFTPVVPPRAAGREGEILRLSAAFPQGNPPNHWPGAPLRPILGTSAAPSCPLPGPRGAERLDAAFCCSPMATHHPIRKHVPAAPPEIPDKLYFRIGDVARLCEVPAYVLRFWETEFPQLKPNKGGTGQRLYRKRDVEMALRIKSLLYDQGYTIPGARQAFKAEARGADASAAALTASATPFPQAPDEMAAAPAPASGPSLRERTSMGRSADPGELERDRSLHALRNELRALQSMLTRPVSPDHAPVEPKNVQTMRPRLVLEPRPEKKPRPESKPGPRLQLNQRDLFGFDDPGPAAS